MWSVNKWILDRHRHNSADRVENFFKNVRMFIHTEAHFIEIYKHVWRNSLPSWLSYRKEDSCCLATWPEWTRQLAPGGLWLVSIRAIGVGQLGTPTPPGWPLWRASYLCTIWPSRTLYSFVSLRLGALWLLCFNGAGYKHSYLLTYLQLALDKSLWRLLVASGATHWHGACRIMMMMITNKLTMHFSVHKFLDFRKSLHSDALIGAA